MKNLDIRSKACDCGVRLWQIAEALRMTDSNFSRKLRKELSPNEKETIFAIIDRLALEVK